MPTKKPLPSFGSAYHLLAIDIETSGSSFKQNGVVSLGASLQDQNSNELDSFQMNLNLPEGHVYEMRCVKEFWSENKKAYDFVQQNTVAPKEAMDKFCAFLTKAETRFPELIVISDNPSFDMAWLNLYLDEYTDRSPLNYTENMTYRIIWDTYSMLKVLLCERGDFESSWELPEKLGFKSQWTPDHNPLNDARTIADYFNQTVKEMKKNFENKETQTMEKGLYYLALPYQGTEEEKKYRTELSLKAVTEFLRQGIHVFAPLNYVNKIVEELAFTSLEKRREIVLPYLLDFLRVSKGMVVINIDGWENSWGVQQEMKFCHEMQIPVYNMKPEQIYGDLSKILSTSSNFLMR